MSKIPQLSPLPWVVSFVVGVLPFVMVFMLCSKSSEGVKGASVEYGCLEAVEW